MDHDSDSSTESEAQTLSPDSQQCFIDSLPIETLIDILKYGPRPSYPEHKNSRYEPMRVSHRWRDAALCCHDLWTSIHIYKPRSPPPILRAKGQVDGPSLKEWLFRSRQAPLDITIDVHGKDRESSAGASLACKYLFMQAYRWKSFDIFGPPRLLKQTLRILPRAKQIASLSIAGPPVSLHDLDERKYYTLTLSSLTELTLSFLAVDGLPRFALANLRQLTLKEGILDDLDFDQLSEDLPKLEKLIIDAHPGEHSLEWWVNEGRQPIFTSLRSLEVMSAALVEEDSNLLSIVRYIPNVEELTFKISSSTLELLDNLHACPLKSLSVELCQDEVYEGTVFDADSLRTSLGRATHLTSFTLKWADPLDQAVETFFSPFLQALTLPSPNGESSTDNSVICPELASLHLIQCNFEMDDLLAFAQLRSGTNGSGSSSVAACEITLEKCFGYPDVARVRYEDLRKALFSLEPMNLPFATFECGCGCCHGSDSDYCDFSDGDDRW